MRICEDSPSLPERGLKKRRERGKGGGGTRTYRRSQFLTESRNVLNVKRSSPELGPIAPTVCAGADSRPLKASGHHRACYEVDDRLVRRDAAHELGGRSLITSYV